MGDSDCTQSARPCKVLSSRLDVYSIKLVARGDARAVGRVACVPLEHAAADGNIDLFNALIGARADGSAGWRGCHDPHPAPL